MPVIAANITSSIETLTKSGVTEAYGQITPEMEDFIKAIAKAVGDTIFKTLTVDAIVAGGTCAPGGPLAGGKIT